MSLLFRFYPYIAGMAALIAVVIWIWLRGYHACQNEHELQNAHQAEVKNEIRNKPHSVDLTVKRLSNGTF